jgi:hypothetical protein
VRLHHAPPPECGVHYLCSARPLFALNGLGASELAPTKDRLRDSLTVATFVHAHWTETGLCLAVKRHPTPN